MGIIGNVPDLIYPLLSKEIYNDHYAVADWIFADEKKNEMLSIYWEDKADYTTYDIIKGSFIVFKEANEILSEDILDKIKADFIAIVDAKYL